jgi:hypothetical protein
MNSSEKFNQFVHQNGGSVLYLDENLVLQKEVREEIVFWGSVYQHEFVEMPDNALTSEGEYRKWCWKHTGFMPKKRTPAVFDDYIRPKMMEAVERVSLPGTEYGVEVEDAIELATETRRLKAKDLDAGDEWSGEWLWVETLDERMGQEVVIRLKGLMKVLLGMESVGTTEGKIKRRDVCRCLIKYGRQVAGRDASVNRLRCAYALPIGFLDGGFDGVRVG